MTNGGRGSLLQPTPLPSPQPDHGSSTPTARNGTFSARAHPVAFAVAFAVLCTFIPLLLLQQVPDVGRSRAWLGTILLALLAGTRLSVIIARGIPVLFDFVFWLFTYIFLGLAPTIQMRSGRLPTTTTGIDPRLDSVATIAVWVGVLAYSVGSLLYRAVHARPSKGGPAQLPPPTSPDDPVSPTRTWVVAAFGLAAAAFYIASIGFATLFLDRYGASAARAAALPDPAFRSILIAAGSYPLLIAAAVFARLLRTAPRGFRRDSYVFGLVATVPVLILVMNPISSARYDFGTAGFALLVLMGAAATVRRTRIFLSATIVAFVAVFPIADAFRTTTVNTRRAGFFGEYAGNPDYDAFWQIANTIEYVAVQGLNIGNQFLGVILFWVPRSLWPDKPVDTGVLLAQFRGYRFENLSAPLWAEFLINGSWLLLVVGFVAVGYLLARLDSKISRSLLGGGQFWAVVGAVFPFYTVILLRGSLLQATGTLMVALTCLIFVRQPRSSAPPGRAAPPSIA